MRNYLQPVDRRLLPENRFDAAASSFVRARPSYPAELVAEITRRSGVEPGAAALDVAAGAGALTEPLAAAGFAVTAVEPGAEMGRRLRERLPDIEVRAEKAENLGVDDDAVGLVTIANGLHWVDPGRAYAEFARVLAPGGHVAVVWQLPDGSDPRQERLWELLGRLHRNSPEYPGPAPGSPAGWTLPLATVDRWRMPNVHRIPRALLGDYIGSWSGVANLEPAKREAVIAEVGSWWEGEAIDLPFEISVELGRLGGR